MNRKRCTSRAIVLAAAIFTGSCFASAIFPADASCNPGIDPPVSGGGCVWYDFYTVANGNPATIAGASGGFSGFYTDAPSPAWTFTVPSGQSYDFRVVDGGHQGDTFSVFNNGSLVGSTSPTANNTGHPCGGLEADTTDPAICWDDPLMSQGTFVFGPGDYSITITWDQQVSGGASTLQWFELGQAPVEAGVPEPSTWLMLASGMLLMGIGALRKFRKQT